MGWNFLAACSLEGFGDCLRVVRQRSWDAELDRLRLPSVFERAVRVPNSRIE